MEECIKRLAFLAKNPGLNQVFWDTYKIYSSKLERAMKGFKDNINGVGL